MAPVVEVGEAVLVESRTPQPGELAAFASKEGVLVHRYLGEIGDRVLHRGDRTAGAALLPRGSLLGRVIGVAPATGDTGAERELRVSGLRRALTPGERLLRIFAQGARLPLARALPRGLRRELWGLCGRIAAAPARLSA